MQDITDELILAMIFDGTALSPDAASHLQSCPDCQGRAAAFAQLQQEMGIARRSAVSPEAEARYQALFDQVERTTQGAASRVAAWLTAVLTWDSRSAAPAAAVRSGAAAGYRMLYQADDIEVELAVDGEQGLRHVEGEVITSGDTGTVLVELAPLGRVEPADAVESAPSGRFRFERVRPGVYRLAVTPVHGPVIEIAALDIT